MMNIDLILKKLSKNNPILNNQIYFNFDNTEIIGNISDASNCFNINSMVLLKDGNYLENTETINAFRRLMNSFDIEDNLIEEIIDQIIDWIDKDSNPRTYGLEDYYYSDHYTIQENTAVCDYSFP